MTELTGRRALVLRGVHAVPGAHLRELQRITRLAWGTLRYHVDVLIAQGEIVTEVDRRFRRHYPRQMPAHTRRTWDAIRTLPTRRILEALLVHPTSQARLCVQLGMAPSSMHRYVALLRRLDALEGSGNILRLTRPDETARLLQSADLNLFDQLADGAIGMFDDLDR